MINKAKLYEKIIAVMNKVGQLRKDGSIEDSNGKLMYKYLSEEQTTGDLQRAFVEFKLVMFPIKVEEEHFYIETLKYDKLIKAPITKVIVTYKICDAETGESEEIQSVGYGSDSQDKGSNKAMTGAFKYAQRQTFMISTGDDGDHTSSESLDKQLSGVAPPNKGAQSFNGQQPPSNSQPPSNASTGQAGQSSDGISDGQRKMLYAKHNHSYLKGSFDRISDCLGYPITKFEEVKRADVNKLIALLDEHKAS